MIRPLEDPSCTVCFIPCACDIPPGTMGPRPAPEAERAPVLSTLMNDMVGGQGSHRANSTIDTIWTLSGRPPSHSSLWSWP